ncbi:PAS domain S-box protein, partial [Acinetobacter baumannii]
LLALSSAQIFEESQQQAAYLHDRIQHHLGRVGEIVLLKRADGSTLPAELRTSPIDGSSQRDQIWVLIDISERLEAESSIARL